MDLSNAKKLMKERDWHGSLSHPIPKYLDVYLGLADEVPGLVEEVERLKAEVDVLNGSACREEQKDGKGPCGVCTDCYRAKIKDLELQVDAMTELLEQFAASRHLWDNHPSEGVVGCPEVPCQKAAKYIVVRKSNGSFICDDCGKPGAETSEAAALCPACYEFRLYPKE